MWRSWAHVFLCVAACQDKSGSRASAREVASAAEEPSANAGGIHVLAAGAGRPTALGCDARGVVWPGQDRRMVYAGFDGPTSVSRVELPGTVMALTREGGATYALLSGDAPAFEGELVRVTTDKIEKLRVGFSLPMALVASGGRLYFFETENGQPQLEAFDLATREVKQFATKATLATSVTVSGSVAVLASPSGSEGHPLDGGDAVALPAAKYAAAAGGFIAMVSQTPDERVCELVTVPVKGGASKRIATLSMHVLAISSLATLGERVCITDRDAGAVLCAPLDGGPLETVAQNQPGATQLHACGTHLVWARDGGGGEIAAMNPGLSH